MTRMVRCPPGSVGHYMMELVNYGGEMLPRGYVYQLLLNVAKAQGHDKSQWRVLADRWMQGYDLQQRLKDGAK